MLPYRLDGTLAPGLRVAVALNLDRRLPRPDLRVVTGRVLDGAGAPVAAASIVALGDRGRSVATAADGSYTLTVPGDLPRLEVVATTPDRGTSAVVAVALDGPTTSLPPLVLDDGVAIVGTVVPAPDVAGALVLATPLVAGAADAPPGPAAFLLDGATRRRARLFTPIGADGAFRLRGATAGLWRIARTGARRFAGTVHPDLEDAFATVVRVPGPAIALGAPAQLLTVVARAGTTPVAGATVSLRRDPRPPRRAHGRGRPRACVGSAPTARSTSPPPSSAVSRAPRAGRRATATRSTWTSRSPIRSTTPTCPPRHPPARCCTSSATTACRSPPTSGSSTTRAARARRGARRSSPTTRGSSSTADPRRVARCGS